MECARWRCDENVGCDGVNGHGLATYRVWRDMIVGRLWTTDSMGCWAAAGQRSCSGYL